MRDIAMRADVELLVNSFYDVVRKDDRIGYIFDEIIGADWSHHLPVMYSFWESVLLGKAGYSGNPIKKHIDMDKHIPLMKEHFERWLELWNMTVNRLFAGEVAELALNRAALMANLINIKVEMAREGKIIG